MSTLARTLRERDITLLFIGAVIGSGIFIVPATVLRQVQGAFGLALAVWIAGGVLSLLGALTYAELGASAPKAGGLYVYIRDGFGPFPAFLYGWTLFFLISSSSTATLAVAFSAYLGTIVPLSWVAAKAVSVAMIAGVALVNIRGTRYSANLQNWTTAIKVGGILIMGAVLFIWGEAVPPLTLWPSTADAAAASASAATGAGTGATGGVSLIAGIGLSMIGVLWAYEGWQYATFNAGETIEPQRALPRAFLLGSSALVVIYLIANVGYVTALGVERAAASPNIAAAAVSAVAGPAAARLVALMILIAIASAGNSLMLTSPRVYYAMAQDGLFFKRLAEVHPRFGTPAFAIAAGASWSMLLALSGTFDQLLTFVVFSGWIFYGLAAASIFVYRRRHTPRPFSVPGYPLTPLLFIASAAAVIISTLVLAPTRGLIGLGIVLLGAPAYLIWRRPRAVAAAVIAIVATLSASATPAAAQTVRYDLIIAHGLIVDGSGNPWYRGDIGIVGDRIRDIGDLSAAEATRRIDATGLIVAPGFIDLHSHSINGLNALPTADNSLFQGVTTAIDGNDGSSPLPIGAALDRLIPSPISINLGFFAGHGTIRRQVMGMSDRLPTAEEQGRMNALAAEAMRDGAMGLSTGLAYVPGAYAKTDELIALSKVVGAAGGIYTSHMRDEGRGTRDSVRETIRIGEGAGLPVEISHIKVAGRGQFGDSAPVLDLIAQARARGLDVTFDQYPYAASSTGLNLIIPRWALADDKLAVHLADPASRAKVVSGMVAFLEEYMGDDPSVIQLSRCRFDPTLDGKRLSELLKIAHQPLTREATANLILDLEGKGGCSAIYHWMAEGDVERFLRSPFGMIASDGGVVAPGVGSPHPRSYGTFPRVLGRYVRDKQVLTIEEAIRRMTSYPAQRLSLRDRGLLRPNLLADIVVFDAATIADRATFEQPHQHATGVRDVIVNGTLTIDNGTHTGAKAGRPVYGPGRPARTP